VAIKAIIDDLEKVEEGLRGLYRQVDGKYRLEVEDPEALVDVAGLKSALDKERKARREAEARAKEFQGIDPKEYRRLQDELARSQEEQAARDGQWDKYKSLLEARHARRLQKLEQELKEAREANFKLVAEGGLTEALLAAGVRQELLPFVRSHLLPRVSLVHQEGRAKAMVGEVELSQFVKAWAQSPEGAATLAAPDNLGGGGGSPAGAAPPESDLRARLRQARKNRDAEAVMRLETAIFRQRHSLG